MQIFSHKNSIKLANLISLLVITGYFTGLLAWYVSPTYFWPFGLASIGFVYMWFALPLFIIFWLRKNQPTKGYGFLFLMLLGWQPISASVSVGVSATFAIAKDSTHIRIMQWNCEELQGSNKYMESGKASRQRAVDFINTYKPDVICVQDFAEIVGKYTLSNFNLFSDSLNYPYRNFYMHSHNLMLYGFVHQGIGIFSKLPFLQQGWVAYEDRDFPESIVWVDILLQGKPVRIVSTHFRSINLMSHKEFNPAEFPRFQLPDSAIIMHQNPLIKLQFYQKEHARQAILLRHFLDTCRVPTILCADLNTVPASNTYKKVRGDHQDGFLASTTGLGATYNYLAPNLRIDYIFNHPLLRKSQWKHFQDGFFNHDHLMGDYFW